jgi:uncharacterized protein (DUF1810 family)
MPRAPIDLERFERHHPDDFERALGEIESGRKRSHWMWFIFPQITSLGRSATAIEYGINSVDEAGAYLRHPTLGHDYAHIVAAVWSQVVQGGVGLTELMGRPDDLKLVSSLTLFATIARRTADPELSKLADQCDDILAIASLQGLAPCQTTAVFLAD